MRNKIGIILITIGGVIILTLLYILAFVDATKNESTPGTFKGPTSPPRVEGPKEAPPTEN